MKNVTAIALGLFSALLMTHALAYEVWIGTHLMRSSDASNLSSWELAASQVDGFNVNRAPHDTDPASDLLCRNPFR